MSNIYTDLARQTIEMYLTKNELPNTKSAAIELQQKRAACFVTLHTESGNLCGCIGSIRPMYKSLAGEIIANTVAAATQDTRFTPVRASELGEIRISVDVLKEPELIASQKELDIKRFGLIVQADDGRNGLLLPDIEGIKNIDEQVTIAREKAGIDKDEPIALFRFSAERFSE